MSTDYDEIRRDFGAAVNMTPEEMDRWLETDESKEVGWVRSGDIESIGHQSGRRIVEISRRETSKLTADDYDHMRKVVGYIHRHLAQRPEGDISNTRWRYSLMNWGHDPLKDRK